MSDQHDKQSPSNPADTVRGTIPAGPRDSSLQAATQPSASPAVPQSPVVADQPLQLPRGGLVAMRKSGGFTFSSREIVIYSDGRVRYAGSNHVSHIKAAAQQRISAEQVLELRRLLTEARLPQLAATSGKHSPDTFAYEIVARIGRKVSMFEAFEGSIPESLAPLIQQLRELMPAEA